VIEKKQNRSQKSNLKQQARSDGKWGPMEGNATLLRDFNKLSYFLPTLSSYFFDLHKIGTELFNPSRRQALCNQV
jgi:hypothetical protein